MEYKTLTEIKEAIHSKKLSSCEITKYYLEKIKKYNNKINAFITVLENQALDKAKKIDDEIVKGNIKNLSGIPIAQKDIFCTKGIKTTCGSKMLENFISPYDATVIEKLENAGTIMLGKTNMDEFAMGSSNETSHFGDVKNPWNINCLLYTSPSPRDRSLSRMPSSA